MADKRALGVLELLALGINGVVGVGIFFAPSELAAAAPGYGSVLVFAVTGIALLPVAVAVSKLGAHLPEDGGPVLYARTAFGDAVGFTVGWVTYVSALLSTSTVLVGLARALVGNAHPRLFAAALGTVLASICALGLKASARIWSVLTVAKLLPLLGLAALTMTAHGAPPGTGSSSWLRAGLTATFVFQGFEIVPLLAGRARNPTRAMPVAVLGSLLSATVLYLLLQRGAVLAVPDLAHAEAPLVSTAAMLGGSTWGRVLGVGTSISALGIAFGMLTTTPHYLAVLAAPFAPERRAVPLRALAFTWVSVMILVLALGELGELFALSSLAVILQFLVIALSLGRLAWSSRFDLRRRDTWPVLPTIAVTVLLWSAATAREWLVAGALALSGVAFRFAFLRRRP